jgi:hypothetical protein
MPMIDASPIGFITASQAAMRLRVDSHAIYRLVQRGVLQGEQRDGKWFVEIASVETLRAAKAAADSPRGGENGAVA